MIDKLIHQKQLVYIKVTFDMRYYIRYDVRYDVQYCFGLEEKCYFANYEHFQGHMILHSKASNAL